MTTAGFAAAQSPVNDDEAETHYHKQEANPSKTGSLEERTSDLFMRLLWEHKLHPLQTLPSYLQ